MLTSARFLHCTASAWRKALALACFTLAVAPACLMAQNLPCAPPSDYDTKGLYPAGSVNTVSYYSSVAGGNLNMMVYTPPGYDPSKKYGVIYCYQGISTGIDTIFDDWCVGAGFVADNLIGKGTIKPIIIVALDDQYNGTYGSDVRNMTIKDAVPYIDSHYSTYANANHRGVYGFSWGGGYTYNIGCENLDTFRYIGPSSAAPSKDGDDTLFPNGGAEAKQKMKCLFISWGSNDYSSIYDANMGTHNFCVSNGIPHSYWIVDGQGHTSGTWRPAMWNFLQLADRAGISDPDNDIILNGTYKLIARHSGKALEAAGNGTANGTQIQQWDYFGTGNQKWTLTDRGSGNYSVIGVQSGKALDIDYSSGGTANGTKVQLWDYWAGPSQLYKLTATDSGYYRLTPNCATSSALDVNGISTANGAKVQLWTWNGQSNQQWLLQPDAPANGTYKIISRNSGKAMEAAAYGTANGTQIQQWDYFGTTSQQWTLTDTGSGNYKIIGLQSGKSLDIDYSSGGTANGTKVQLWDYWTGPSQLYRFTSTDSGYYRITPNCATGSCLDVSDVSTTNGATVHLWQWLNASNQQWSLQTP